jgi:hypothetical protein
MLDTALRIDPIIPDQGAVESARPTPSLRAAQPRGNPWRRFHTSDDRRAARTTRHG